MRDPIECVIPAAGESSRFGGNKLLEPWGTTVVVNRVVSTALSYCDRVIVVTGSEADAVRRVLPGDSRLETTNNDAFALGMFSSIQTGLRLTRSSTVMVMLGDMPGIPGAVVGAVLAAPAAPWIRPARKGVPGHPVRIARELVDELCSLPRATGRMRHVLDAHRGITIDTNDIGAVLDVDTRADYELLRRSHDA